MWTENEDVRGGLELLNDLMSPVTLIGASRMSSSETLNSQDLSG